MRLVKKNIWYQKIQSIGTNFEAATYRDIINGENIGSHATATTPIHLQRRSEVILQISENLLTLTSRKYHATHKHTQSVERCVKLVTEAASSCFGPNKIDGFIQL